MLASQAIRIFFDRIVHKKVEYKRCIGRVFHKSEYTATSTDLKLTDSPYNMLQVHTKYLEPNIS